MLLGKHATSPLELFWSQVVESEPVNVTPRGVPLGLLKFGISLEVLGFEVELDMASDWQGIGPEPSEFGAELNLALDSGLEKKVPLPV